MTVKAWPFLVSRNKTIGYRAIVAPDFIVDAKISALIAHNAGGDLTKRKRYRHLPNTKVGDITLVYRVIHANNEKNLFRDEFGRPILWIEGFVLIGLRKDIEIPEEMFEENHSYLEAYFIDFWQHNNIKNVSKSKATNIFFEKKPSLSVHVPGISNTDSLHQNSESDERYKTISEKSDSLNQEKKKKTYLDKV